MQRNAGCPAPSRPREPQSRAPFRLLPQLGVPVVASCAPLYLLGGFSSGSPNRPYQPITPNLRVSSFPPLPTPTLQKGTKSSGDSRAAQTGNKEGPPSLPDQSPKGKSTPPCPRSRDPTPSRILPSSVPPSWELTGRQDPRGTGTAESLLQGFCRASRTPSGRCPPVAPTWPFFPPQHAQHPAYLCATRPPLLCHLPGQALPLLCPGLPAWPSPASAFIQGAGTLPRATPLRVASGHLQLGLAWLVCKGGRGVSPR